MAYTGRATPLEERRIRWLSFDEAMDALDLEKSRRVLRSANRMISLATGGEPPRRSRVLRVAARFAEWIVGGALALIRARDPLQDVTGRPGAVDLQELGRLVQVAAQDPAQDARHRLTGQVSGVEQRTQQRGGAL